MKMLLSALSADGLKTVTVELDEESLDKTIRINGGGLPVELTITREFAAQLSMALGYATIPWKGEGS
jgi:hypothetical protein